MQKEKALRIEMARENPITNGYLYSTLDLPAEEHEIRDSLQRLYGTAPNESVLDISIIDSPYMRDLQNRKILYLAPKNIVEHWLAVRRN